MPSQILVKQMRQVFHLPSVHLPELWFYVTQLSVSCVPACSMSPENSLEGLMLKLKLQYFGHLCEELTHLKRSWCWGRLKAGGEGDARGWDSWMASPTWWTWVWVSSGSWWWTGKPGVLQSMGSQRVGHNWATELKWEGIWKRVDTCICITESLCCTPETVTTVFINCTPIWNKKVKELNLFF